MNFFILNFSEKGYFLSFIYYILRCGGHIYIYFHSMLLGDAEQIYRVFGNERYKSFLGHVDIQWLHSIQIYF